MHACWNCGEEVPEDAKVCRRCEADLKNVPPITDEDREAVGAFVDLLPEEARDAMRELFENSDTAEDFVNAIMVGSCPACGGENVGDCEKDPDYNDITLGRCFDCGTVWCTDCEYVLKKGETVCPNDGQHTWDDLDLDPE